MAKFTTKYNLPQNYKNKDDLIDQIIEPINSAHFWNKTKQPTTQQEWSRLLFQNNGWQLTFHGSNLLRSTFVSYEIPNVDPNQLTGKVIINLNRLLDGPWCHRVTSLYIWNQPRWFEMQMFEGDLKRFVDFYAPAA